MLTASGSSVFSIGERCFTKYFVFIFFFALNHAEAFESDRYYCHFYEDKRGSSFDKMVVISQTEQGRVLNLDLHGNNSLYKTYDEDSRIFTVYKESMPYSYFFLKLESGEKVFLYFGYGLHRTIKGFEKSYGMPFTKKSFDSINRNPELADYLPEKPSDDYKSIAFIKSKYSCEPLSYFEYLSRSLYLIFISILSAG